MTRERLQDRRTGTRFEIVGRLPGTVHVTDVVAVKNISAGGVLMEAPWPLPMDSQLTVTLELHSGTFRAQVKVRHVTASLYVGPGPRYSIGAEFIELDDSVREVIERMACVT